MKKFNKVIDLMLEADTVRKVTESDKSAIYHNAKMVAYVDSEYQNSTIPAKHLYDGVIVDTGNGTVAILPSCQNKIKAIRGIRKDVVIILECINDDLKGQ